MHENQFRNVLFTDESRATLDGPDGWMSGWLLNGTTPQSKIRRQQGGGGVMIWAGIINTVEPLIADTSFKRTPLLSGH